MIVVVWDNGWIEVAKVSSIPDFWERYHDPDYFIPLLVDLWYVPGTIQGEYDQRPHHPVPAIWYKHTIMPHPTDERLRFVSLMDSNGWSDFFCWGDGVTHTGSRPIGICPSCGCDLIDVCQCDW